MKLTKTEIEKVTEFIPIATNKKEISMILNLLNNLRLLDDRACRNLLERGVKIE